MTEADFYTISALPVDSDRTDWPRCRVSGLPEPKVKGRFAWEGMAEACNRARSMLTPDTFVTVVRIGQQPPAFHVFNGRDRT